uniref:Uncharacterized protein n=1 Tax=Kalanchoe fedtschenkoi TaxID=63787 RepID=A0A7N0V906_KALFE
MGKRFDLKPWSNGKLNNFQNVLPTKIKFIKKRMENLIFGSIRSHSADKGFVVKNISLSYVLMNFISEISNDALYL